MNKLTKTFLPLYLLGTFLIITNINAAVPALERAALVALYNSTDGANWIDNTNWLSGDPCDNNWSHVVCVENSVIELHMSNLKGYTVPFTETFAEVEAACRYNEVQMLPCPVPPPANNPNLVLIENLTSLKILDLSSNKMCYGAPFATGENLQNALNLEHLDLSSNWFYRISGTYQSPTSCIQTIGLSSNLGGLGNLPKIKSLNLSKNYITDVIDPSLGNMSTIESLDFSGNNIYGTIPTTFDNLINLISTNFDYNALLSNDATLDLNALCSCDWMATQTIAPINLQSGAVTNNSVNLSWDAVSYTQAGGYDILAATNIVGPFIKINTIVNKTITSITQTGLDSGTTYYFKVESYTDSHNTNLNRVRSYDSNIITESTTGTHQAEIDALVALYGSTNGDSWINNNATWLVGDPCDNNWFGITCIANSVTEIDLSSNNLVGTIPASLSNLTNLSFKDINYNAISENFSPVDFGSWILTQTLAPENIQSEASNTSITLNWDTVSYTQTGGYIVLISSNISGPFSMVHTTTDKSVLSYTQTNLILGETYYFRVESFTNSHGNNPNEVISDDSAIISAKTGTLQAEIDALELIYTRLGGANWVDNSNWLVGDPCDNNWAHVVCVDNSVTELHMSNLKGNEDPIIGSDIAGLCNILLGAPPATGSIESRMHFEDLTNLKILDLSSNKFCWLPDSIQNATSLEQLDLSSNWLYGFGNYTRPFYGTIFGLNNLSNLPNIKTLDLSANYIIEDIPSVFGNMTSIESFDLSSNNIGGTVPSSFHNLANLANLNLDYNAISANDSTVALDSDWLKTQTLAPKSFNGVVDTTKVRLAWTAVDFLEKSGGYVISTSENNITFYDLSPLPSKHLLDIEISGLNNSNNYFKIQSYTAPHENNRNEVYSDFSGIAEGQLSQSAPDKNIKTKVALKSIISGQASAKNNFEFTAVTNTVVEYQIEVSNLSAIDVTDVRFIHNFPGNAVNTTWTCTGSLDAPCPVGQDMTQDIDVLLDMLAGSSIVFDLRLELETYNPETGINLSAQVITDDGADSDISNNSDSIVVNDYIFDQGFEQLNN